MGLSAIDAASGAKENNTAKKWYEAPGLRGFTAAPYQSSNSVQRVYDDYKEQEKLHNAFKLTGNGRKVTMPKNLQDLKMQVIA